MLKQRKLWVICFTNSLPLCGVSPNRHHHLLTDDDHVIIAHDRVGFTVVNDLTSSLLFCVKVK